MTKNEFIQAVQSAMAFSPTADQKKAIEVFANYLSHYDKDSLFLLRGYAGTGKTTLINAFVQFFKQKGIQTILLAPTGRAAKVLSSYTNQPAVTIHKEIYRIVTTNIYNRLVVKKNEHKNAVFFVDEASMIYDDVFSENMSVFDKRSLLSDLFDYVKNGINCALIFVGDNAQLPPVGSNFSPALDKDYLKNHFSKIVYEVEMKEVMRQTKQSGILFHATNLRQAMTENYFPIYKFEPQFNDVLEIKASDFMEELQSAYQQYGYNGVVLITKSNKQANLLNATIRTKLLFRENELDSGDFVMSVKNNYFWLDESAKTPFIANGDIMEILSVRKHEEMYGFHFVTAKVRMVDYNMPPIEVKILLDTLFAEEAALSYEKSKQLFAEIEKDYMHIPIKRERLKALQQNEYLNALQIKFAYAQTCHKTQGGQWDKVFILQWNNAQQQQTLDYFRWAYTALTRAKKQVFLINA